VWGTRVGDVQYARLSLWNNAGICNKWRGTAAAVVKATTNPSIRKASTIITGLTTNQRMVILTDRQMD